MIIQATQRYVRQSPQKVTLVANAVKDLPLQKAIDQLGVIEKKATTVILKVLRQAIANATNNLGIPAEELELHTIHVSEGPRYKRWRAVSRGRAHSIIKRTCHVRVELSTKIQDPIEISKSQVKTKGKKKQKKTKDTKKTKASIKKVEKIQDPKIAAKMKGKTADDVQAQTDLAKGGQVKQSKQTQKVSRMQQKQFGGEGGK